jgi:hypothetical protein
MIFDSNQRRALPFSHSNLDACCLVNKDATFTMVHSGYHYLLKRRKQNKSTKKEDGGINKGLKLLIMFKSNW